MTHETQSHRDNANHLPPEKLTEEAATWFIRMRGPHVSEHDQRRFTDWLAAAERHQREYASFEKLWGRLDGLSRPQPRKKRLAGSVLALIAAVALAFVFSTQTVDQQQITGIGETRQLALADGSVIDIDAASALRIEYTPWRRRITLERGQALFKVASGLRPFEVKAGAASLRDIGTTFNVLDDQGKVTVSVQEGAVEISLDVTSKKRLLTGGQQATYNASEIFPTKTINPQSAEAWLNNRWIFEDVSLGDVVRQINRQHERPVSLADASLDRYRISGVFDRSDRAGLLKAITTLHPVRLDESPQGTRLLRAH